MSKLFQVIKKDTLIDFGDVCQEQPDSFEDLQQRPEEPSDAHTQISQAPACMRSAHLRISALAPIFPFDTGNQPAADQYRIIRTKILHHPRKPRLIVVSGACSGDGKTTTAINLAASLALKEDARVLLVDGDLRNPCIADVLGIPAIPGLTQVLGSGATNPEYAIMRTEQVPNLFVLPASRAAESAAELLDSQSWRIFVEQVRQQFTTVIFDAPPIATVADYELLQLACDGVIIVARPDHSDRSACLKALKTVPREKCLGIVLNGIEDWWLWKSQAYGYYPKHSPKGGR